MLIEERLLKKKLAEIEIEKWTRKVIKGIVYVDEKRDETAFFVQIGMIKAITEVYKVKDAVIIEIFDEFYTVFECIKLLLLLMDNISNLNIRQMILTDILTSAYMLVIGKLVIDICEKIEIGELNFEDVGKIRGFVMENFSRVVESIYGEWKNTLENQNESKLEIEEAKLKILEYLQ